MDKLCRGESGLQMQDAGASGKKQDNEDYGNDVLLPDLGAQPVELAASSVEKRLRVGKSPVDKLVYGRLQHPLDDG